MIYLVVFKRDSRGHDDVLKVGIYEAEHEDQAIDLAVENTPAMMKIIESISMREERKKYFTAVPLNGPMIDFMRIRTWERILEKLFTSISLNTPVPNTDATMHTSEKTAHAFS